MIGIVWDASIIGGNWCSLTYLITKLKSYIDITDWTWIYTCYNRHLIVHWTLAWLILPTWYICIDYDRQLTWFDIWFLYWLTLLLSIHVSYVISVFFHYYLSLCTHYLYARVLPLFLTHSLGRFLMTLDSHVQILDVLCYWSGIGRGSQAS